MIDLWNNISLTVVDFLLGWLLRFPTSVAILVVSVGSGAILTLARTFTTDQEKLAIAADDRKRQKELAKEAKARKDKEAAKRHSAVRTQISVTTLNQEWKPLLVSLIPIAMLATWAVERLEFHPPAVDEPVEIVSYVPRRLVGQTMHIVPVDGLEPGSTWIAIIEPGEIMGIPCGEARWELRATQTETAPQKFDLQFRLEDNTLDSSLLLGDRKYATPRRWFPEHEIRIDTELVEVRPFGFVPGIPAIMFPPWLIAYILLVVPSVFLTKKLFGIN
ncbi:MAG: DUF106 domain-containing protein [Verrucomicrobia bacterium]|nr:DUF106 domain-containing protein [Verrucomicrobiota bacterium]MCH8513967.1 EMC3/TMCO1 family protein [Kiritimatiellia bacterium]